MSCISGIRRGVAEVAAYQRQQICRANSPAVHIAQRALSHAPRMMLQPSTRNVHPILPQASRIETPKREISFLNLNLEKGQTQYDLMKRLERTFTDKEASLDDRYSSAKELAKMSGILGSYALYTLKRYSEHRNEPDLISHLFASYVLASTSRTEEERMHEFLKSENHEWEHGWEKKVLTTWANCDDPRELKGTDDDKRRYQIGLDDSSDMHISIRYAMRHKFFYGCYPEWFAFAESHTNNAEVRFLRDNLFSAFADVVLADSYLSQTAKQYIHDFWNKSDLNYESRTRLAASIQKIAVNDPNKFHEMIDLLTQLPENLDQKFKVKKLILLTLIEIEAEADPKNKYEIRAVIDGFFDDLKR